MERKRFWPLAYLLFVYCFGILIFTGFRLALLSQCYSRIGYTDAGQLLNAFWLGFCFDTMVSSYLLILPMLVLLLAYYFRIQWQWVYKAVGIYLILTYSIFFLISATDIPYYNHFASRLNVAVLNWFNSVGIMLRFVFSDWGYYPYLLAFILSVIGFAFVIKWARTSFLDSKALFPSYRVKPILFHLLMVLGLLCGLRGLTPFSKRPLQLEEAFFSNNTIVNQVSINPVLSFIQSCFLFKIKYMDDAAAIKKVQEQLGINKVEFASPIARSVTPQGQLIKPNVVLVIMESMTADVLQRFGGKQGITPNLDTLANNGLSFDNIYTAGIHTQNGIYSTLFGYPALMRERPMANTLAMSQPFGGMAAELGANGYQTVFFCTNEEEFDNMGNFLRNNAFQKVHSMKDYPKAEVVNSWGVSDEYLFSFATNSMNKMSESNKPFFATVLTVSTHPPHMLPPNTAFKPKPGRIEDQVYEYADWCIGKFLKKCVQQPWYNNTVFLFIADHGANITNKEAKYDMPLSFHHAPFIVFAPWLIKKPQVNNSLGGQMDVYPTLMGLLNIPYVNNTMGVDLLKQKRPFMYFSADDKLGCLDKDYFLIVRNNGKATLHGYSKGSTEDLYNAQLPLVDSMKQYTYSMLQTTQWLIRNRLVGKQFSPATKTKINNN